MTPEDKEFYMGIWNTREHRCQVCGCYLGREPRSYNFEHLLEKQTYPQLRHNKDNVILICGDDHYVKNNGHPKPKHQEFIKRAKEELL